MTARSAARALCRGLAGAALFLVLHSVPASGSRPAAYTLDPSRSRFLIHVFRGGIFGVFGHNHTIAVRDYTGTVTVGSGMLEAATLILRVRAGSLRVVDNTKEEERRKIERTMQDEVLESERYPEITFESAGVSSDGNGDETHDVIINGLLTLHGVTRPVIVEARVEVDGDTLRASGEVSLKQKDYGIKPVTVAHGTVKVKNKIKLSFDLVAERK